MAVHQGPSSCFNCFDILMCCLPLLVILFGNEWHLVYVDDKGWHVLQLLDFIFVRLRRGADWAIERLLIYFSIEMCFHQLPLLAKIFCSSNFACLN